MALSFHKMAEGTRNIEIIVGLYGPLQAKRNDK